MFGQSEYSRTMSANVREIEQRLRSLEKRLERVGVRTSASAERRVLAGQQGMIVWWKMKAGAHAAAHQHPHEQIVWMLKGKMDFRIGNDRRSMVAGDVAVIPGNVEHEGIFPEDTEVVDIFAPPREDFLTGDVPSYMRTS
jgi:quercetin dioxygenase-like cupin family protein